MLERVKLIIKHGFVMESYVFTLGKIKQLYKLEFFYSAACLADEPPAI